MALIYQKLVTDKTLILDPREYVMRPFDLGADWTEIRFGFFWTPVQSGNDNLEPAGNEVIAINNAQDWITAGFKDSATTALPGQATAFFLGHIGWNNVNPGQCSLVDLGATWRIGGSNTATTGHLAGYDGVTLKGSDAAAGVAPQAPDASLAAGYNGFFGVKCVLTNRGLATQQAQLSSAVTATVAGTDYSIAALRQAINNGVYTGGAAFAWNDGAAALTVPDAVFLRLPFFVNRIRISAMMVVRYA